MADEDKKIFVDESWKAQVQRERDLAAQKAQEEAQSAQAQPADPAAAAASAGPMAGAAPDAQSPAPGAEGEEGLPEATFLSLVGSLATQAMMSLGVIAPQGQKQVYVDLMQAKYIIDTLMMLHHKTNGNLDEEEATELTQAVAELQQIYVARAQQIQESELKKAGVDITNLKGEQR
jgi:hypothetical protein